MIGTITIGSCKFFELQIAGHRNFSVDSSIMAANREHQDHQRRHQQHHHPSTGHELDDSHDHYRDRCGGSHLARSPPCWRMRALLTFPQCATIPLCDRVKAEMLRLRTAESAGR